MKVNAKIMLVLSMVLLLTFMTGSTAFDVDSLDVDKSMQEDCIVNETISDTALSDDSNFKLQNEKSVIITNENNLENQDNNPDEKEKNNFLDNNLDEKEKNNFKENNLDENEKNNFMEIHEEIDSLNVKCDNDELKNFNGIVMADDAYSCGPASLATVLNRFGMNLTLNEVSQFTDTSQEKGTSMLSLINASKHFGFDAAGVMINASDLKENYIVHLNIDGNEHWTVIKNITVEHVFLMDPNEGNINFTLEEFNNIFSGKALIILPDSIQSIQEELKSGNITLLSDDESSKIFGKRMVKKVVGYKTVKKYGFVPHYGWKLMPVVSNGEVHFSQWKYVKGTYYTLGWYTTKEPIYKVYTISDESLTSAPLKNVKKTTKTMKASSNTKKLKASKKTIKKTTKKTSKKTTKKTKK